MFCAHSGAGALRSAAFPHHFDQATRHAAGRAFGFVRVSPWGYEPGTAEVRRRRLDVDQGVEFSKEHHSSDSGEKFHEKQKFSNGRSNSTWGLL